MNGDSDAVDPEMREALQRLERGLREEIQASAVATHGLIAESEGRTREHVDRRLAESEERTRRHFDVVAESLRASLQTVAEGVTAAVEGSMRRDTELAGRVDRLEHRVLGLESRVSVLETPRPRRRRGR